MAKTGRVLDIEPLERLEDKVKLLVGMVDRLRTEHAQATEENARLRVQVEGLQSQLADAEQGMGEIAALREERDQVRARVEDILAQLDGLNL